VNLLEMLDWHLVANLFGTIAVKLSEYVVMAHKALFDSQSEMLHLVTLVLLRFS